MTTCRDCGSSTGKRFALYCDLHRWRHRGKPCTYRLTPERETYLRAHYKPSSRGISQRCARILGVPKWRVCRWAAELGLTSGVRGNNGRPWTAAEDALIERTIGSRHLNWIAKQTNRSITAVIVRAKRLRLSQLPDGYSQTDVAIAFGVERDTVDRWQRAGWLTAKFQPRPGQPYRFTDADLWRFIDQHRTAFSLAKCDQTWLLGLVLDPELRKMKAA